MPRFEDDLRRALSRPEAPAGFAERVLARIEELRPRRSRARSWRWLAAAALVLMALGGLRYWQIQREEARRQKDTARLVWALDLAGRKVRHVEQTVLEKRWPQLFVASREN
jgi:hypothetical protein